MKRFEESAALLGKHKNLKTYFERHSARKSFIETIPENRPGTAGTEPQPQTSEPADVAQATG